MSKFNSDKMGTMPVGKLLFQHVGTGDLFHAGAVVIQRGRQYFRGAGERGCTGCGFNRFPAADADHRAGAGCRCRHQCADRPPVRRETPGGSQYRGEHRDRAVVDQHGAVHARRPVSGETICRPVYPGRRGVHDGLAIFDDRYGILGRRHD